MGAILEFQAPTFEILTMAGGLRNEAERGAGTRWHAVVNGSEFNDNAALCNSRPSIMWSRHKPSGRKVTCPACLRKIRGAAQ